MRKLWIPMALAAVILVVGAFLAVRSLPSRNTARAGIELARAGDASSTDEAQLLAGGATAASRDGGGGEVVEGSGAGAILPGEPVLHGKVTDEEGKPLEGAFVHLQTGAATFRGGRGGMNMSFLRERLLGRSGPADPSRDGYRTGSDGSYAIRIASIPRGSYEVLAIHSEHAPMSESWTWVEESTEINFRLPVGDSITGIVYDPDGKPVGGAVVIAMLDEDGGGFGRGFRGRNFSSKTTSNEDGTFRLGVAPGTFLLEASAKGYSEGDVRAVPSGMEDVEVILEPAQGIAGRVVDASGAPIAGARVRVLGGFGGDGGFGRRGGFGGPGGGGGGRGGRGGGWMRAGTLLFPAEAQVETDAEGAFFASDLSAGEYFVAAEKPGFVPQRSEAKVELDTPAEPLLVTLEAGKVLSGTIKDPQGNPVANAFVAVAVDEERGRERGGRGERGDRGDRGGPGGFRGAGFSGTPPNPEGQEAQVSAPPEPRQPEPHSPFEAAAVAESDASGTFTFDTLAAGKYSVSVQSNEFTVYRQDAIELESPVNLDIVLDPGIALAGAVVSSADGKPIPGARVTFEVDNDDRREIRADSEGNYKLGGLFPGRLDQVVVDAKGFSVSMLEDVQVEKSPAVQKIDFQVDAAAVLSGIVLDGEGAPVFNARITVMPDVEEEEPEGGDGREMWRARRWQMTQIASGKTGPDGRFTLAEVNSNPSVRISIQHQDFKPFRSDPLPVRPAEKREDLRYTLRSGGRIDVLVRDSAGVPFPGARVRVSSKPVEVVETTEPAVEGGGPGGRGGGFRGQGGPGGRGGRGGRGGERGWTRTSGPDGKAYFKGIDGGEYDITASVRNFRPYAASISVMEEQTVSFVLDLGPESWIAGRVTDAAGMPLASVSLEAMREQSNGFERQETRSAEDGSFRIGSLGDGPYMVRARLQGFSERRLEGVEVDRNTDIVLVALGGIAGNVVVAETGAPVTSFAIRVRPEGAGRRGAEGGRGRFAGGPGGGPGGGFGGGPGGGFGGGFGGRDRDRRNFNDAAGAFLIENVTPGSYVLEVTAEGYAGVELPVRVDEGRVTEGILASLVEGLALTGLVQSKAGAIPLQGAQVFLLAMQPRAAGSEEERPQGTLEERRRARDEAAQSRRETRGQATASAEARLAGAALRAASRGGNLVQTTDETGAFQLKDVTPGEYTLVVNHEAFVPARVPIAVASDGVARFIRIDLEKGEELEGTITLADGSAGAGATVFMRSAEGLTKRVMADPSGRYHMQGLLEGVYSFSTRAGEGRRMAPIELTISKGTNRFDFRIEETANR